MTSWLSTLVLCCMALVCLVVADESRKTNNKLGPQNTLHTVLKRESATVLRDLAKRSPYHHQNSIPVLPEIEQATPKTTKLIDDFVMFLALKETGMLDMCLGTRR